MLGPKNGRRRSCLPQYRSGGALSFLFTSGNEMRMVKLSSMEQLVTGQWGIREPPMDMVRTVGGDTNLG